MLKQKKKNVSKAFFITEHEYGMLEYKMEMEGSFSRNGNISET
jgi:hypothetical protein